jgi:hypothetical protein
MKILINLKRKNRFIRIKRKGGGSFRMTLLGTLIRLMWKMKSHCWLMYWRNWIRLEIVKIFVMGNSKNNNNNNSSNNNNNNNNKLRGNKVRERQCLGIHQNSRWINHREIVLRIKCIKTEYRIICLLKIIRWIN